MQVTVNVCRCRLGEGFQGMPYVCERCEEAHPLWRDIEGRTHRLDKLKLSHLSNILRLLGRRVEEYRDNVKITAKLEIALDLVYAEIASRPELDQNAGILKVLTQ